MREVQISTHVSVGILKMWIILGVAISMICGGGCVAPVPHPEYRIKTSRRPVTPEEAAQLPAGGASRADVICLLGEPDFWWEGEEVIAYQWTTSNLGIFWAIGGGGSAAAGFIDIPIHHFLVIAFDKNNQVRRIEFRDPDHVGPIGLDFLRKIRAEKW